MYFKDGDEIICINNMNQDSYLTIGKIYKIIRINHLQESSFVHIVDDTNIINNFLSDRFEYNLKKVRKEKLEKIFNEKSI